MRQNLFLGWNILLAMLFTFYSCSNEMDSDFESDEEAVNTKGFKFTNRKLKK